jgi:hypothetical protein
MSASSTSCHPQVPIDTEGTLCDEKIAPIVAAARRHGLITRWSCQGGDEDPFQLAYLTFPDVKDALEFLLQSAHNLDYQIAEKLVLSVHRPLSLNEGPGGRVTWHPEFTDTLIRAWT